MEASWMHTLLVAPSGSLVQTRDSVVTSGLIMDGALLTSRKSAGEGIESFP
jgi:hypothetical protein